MQKKPPTLRSLATIAGVSAATVSMALRNHPEISKKTRVSIQALAKAEGYSPDPQIRKLMQHLRMTRSQRHLGTICTLTTSAWPDPLDAAWSQSIVNGARSQTKDLGFSWDTLSLEELQQKPNRMAKIVHTRGVEGLFLPPVYNICDLPPLDLWNHISVISTSYSISSPNFHRVVPNQFNNMLVICQNLRELGYRRIGLVISKSHDIRTHYHYSGAFAAFHLSNQFEMIRPLIFLQNALAPALRWIDEVSPDVVIVTSESFAQALHQVRQQKKKPPIAIAVTTTSPLSKWSGIDELPEKVGSRAIDLISGMIMRNEQGIPQNPSTTLIDGQWNHGLSAPPKA